MGLYYHHMFQTDSMEYSEELIDAYINGEMDPEALAGFEAEMKNDASLAARVSFTRSIVDGLRERQKKEESIELWMAQASQKSSARRVWIPWVTSMSAAAAVVAGVFIFKPNHSVVDTYNDAPVMRGAVNSSVDSLIEQGAYDEALRIISEEMARTDSLLDLSHRLKDEAEYDIRKYEFVKSSLQEKLEIINKSK